MADVHYYDSQLYYNLNNELSNVINDISQKLPEIKEQKFNFNFNNNQNNDNQNNDNQNTNFVNEKENILNAIKQDNNEYYNKMIYEENNNKKTFINRNMENIYRNNINYNQKLNMHQQQMHPQQMHSQQMHQQQMHQQQMHPQQMHPQQMHPQQMHPQQIQMYLQEMRPQINSNNNYDNNYDNNLDNNMSLPITPPVQLDSQEGNHNQKKNNKGNEKFVDNVFKCKYNDVDEFLYGDVIVQKDDNCIFKSNNYCNRNITSTFSQIALVDKNIDAFNPKYIDNPRDLNEKIDFIEINNNKSLDLTRIIDYNHLLDIDGAIWDSIFVKNSPNRLIYLLHKFNNSILPFHVNNEGNNLVHLISMSSKDNGVFIDKLIVYYCRYKLDEQFKESFMNKNNLGEPALHLTVMFSTINVAEKIIQINPLTIQQKDNQHNLAYFYCDMNKKKGKIWMSRIQFIINK